MPGVDDHAYSHCLAVLGDPTSAAAAAAVAVRRGGRSRWAVLAHARHEALLRDAVHPAADPAPAAELVEVARWLAASRPPEERAVLDLADRHELDRAALGRVWGVTPAEVGAEVTAAAEAWAHELDPTMLRWLGPGECEDLAAVLGPDASELEATGTEVRSLLPRVRAHAEDCEVCADRVRAMVSVRTLLATAPLESAPAGVGATSRRRRRRPAPAPSAAPPRHRRWTRIAAAVAVVGIAIAAAAVVVAGRNGGPQRVDTLTAVPAGGSALTVDPNLVSGTASPPVSLRNTSPRTLEWTALAKEWLVIQPANGELRPGEQVRVGVALGDNAPEGDVRTTVTFSGGDGSSVALQFEAVVERPPAIDARAEECVVTAAVQDEADLTSVQLQWRSGSAEQTAPMFERDDVWMATLPSVGEPISWSVTATDARGNEASTPPADRPPFCSRT